MESLKKLLTVKSGVERPNRLDLSPTIGFRAEYDNKSSILYVTVIGARHLPSKVKSMKATGYFFKITLFPSKEKFCTSTKQESWPKFDEIFPFTLSKGSFNSAAFLVFTAYITGNERKNEIAGTITWPLRREAFSIDRHPVSATPDLWVEMSDMRASTHKEGNDVQRQRLEISLCYQDQEYPKGVVTISLTALRLSVETIRELQNQKAVLCIKLGLHDGKNWLMPALKKTFSPDISFHWNDFQYKVPLENIEFLEGEWTVRAVVSAKPQYIGKKTILGLVYIMSSSEQWQNSLREPTITVKEWYGLVPPKKK